MVESSEPRPTHETVQEAEYKKIESSRAIIERNVRIINDLRIDLQRTTTDIAELQKIATQNPDDTITAQRLHNAKVHLGEVQELLFEDPSVVQTLQSLGGDISELNAQERQFRKNLM